MKPTRACPRWSAGAMAILAGLSIGTLLPGTGPVAAQHAMDDRTAHLLTIGVCPPWKPVPNEAVTAAMRTACGNAVDALIHALQDRFDVDPANVIRLVDADAGYDAVTGALGALATALDDGDRLYVYINLHGGVVPGTYRGYPVEDEALALWTEERPDFDTAIENHQFIFVRDLRDLVLAIPTGQTVIILDACESGASFRDFRYEPGSLDDRIEHTAIVFSAQFDQAANFTPDDSMALFTRAFVDSLSVSAGQSLANAVDIAARATHGEVRMNCARFGPEIFSEGASYLDLCTQLPLVFDPYGMMDTITVGVPPVPEALQDAEEDGGSSGDGGSAG